jgi:outer membrane protein TolC
VRKTEFLAFMSTVRRATEAAGLTGLSVVLGTIAGCGHGMDQIDARTQRALLERSERLDGGAIAPSRTYPSAAQTQRAGQAAREPASVNPPAAELSFTPADETRDIAKRLEMYDQKALATADARGQVLKLTLSEALRVGQRSAREYLSAEEEYILAAIRVLIERHLWGPRLFNDTTAAVAGTGDEGSFSSALSVINDLKVSQRLPYGGTVEAGWVTRAAEDLRNRVTGQYVQSSELTLDATIPLLRGAGLVAQESLIQSERNLVYAARTFEDFRRTFLVAIARDYFDLLESAAQIKNQEQQLQLLRDIQRGESARYAAGRIAEYQVNIAANDVLRATADLAGQREQYILRLEQFKTRLGLDPQRPIELAAETLELPDPEVSLEEAVERALTYRLDLQNRRDQVDDARRAVANARNAILPDLNLAGHVGVPTDPRAREGGLLVQPGELNYSASVTFGLALDRDAERLQLRAAIIGYQQSERALSLFRDQIAIDVRQSVRNIDLARFQLRLAEQQVEINQRRVYELTIRQDQVDTRTKVDAANALQAGQSARDAAITRLRNALLDYLRQSGQLRVKADGTFEPLPGMEPAAAKPQGPEPVPPPDTTNPPPGVDPSPAEPAPAVGEPLPASEPKPR